MQFTKEELAEILRLHALWLECPTKGKRANLTYADLTCANLAYANLTSANLTCANLTKADLAYANLTGANLACANLAYANLTGANLTKADLDCADLACADLDAAEQCRFGIVLKKPMKGYKKLSDQTICELRIPSGAIVFSINKGKCRTNIAKVIKGSGYSIREATFVYAEGKTVMPMDFDTRYNVECGAGIHFFKTEAEAKNYDL